jgi:SAM-dependent methyltransferase
MKRELIGAEPGRADPVWENEVYGKGNFVRCPYDKIATFVFRNLPSKPRRQTRILEIGCGPGNNLMFLCQEGFAVAGMDASPKAIEYARCRLGGAAELKVAEFPDLPFPDGSFDLVVERNAILCVPFAIGKSTIEQVRRVLVPGGKFLFVPTSDRRQAVDYYTCHYTREMVEESLRDWRILQLHYDSTVDATTSAVVIAEWRVWAERI